MVLGFDGVLVSLGVVVGEDVLVADLEALVPVLGDEVDGL